MSNYYKILRVIESMAPQKGGPAYGVKHSSRLLRDRGHMVDVVTLDKCNDESNVICLGSVYGGWYGFSFKYLFWLIRNLKDYDFVTIHGIWQFSSIGFYLVNLFYGRPYLVMPHGSLDIWDGKSRKISYFMKVVYWKLLERYVYKSASVCLFTSKDEWTSSADYFRLDGIRCDVVPYGSVDPGIFRVKSLASDVNQILYLGRIHPKKGIDLLIKAFSIVFKNDTKAVLHLAGSGDAAYVAELKHLCISSGVDAKVVWYGHIDGEVKSKVILSSGLFVLPSWQENFGLSVSEVMSYGTPVAISKSVNIFHEIKSYDAGFIFDRNIEQIVDALKCWSAGYSSDLIRSNARNCFIDRLSIDGFVNFILSHIESNLRR